MVAGTPKDIRVNLDEANRKVQDNVAGADALRASGLAALQQMRTVKAARLQREQTRLTGKYGDRDPRVVAIGARIATNTRLQRDLGIETARSSMDVPKPDPNTWTLLGHVRDADRRGIPGLTVALFDKTDTWIRSAGYASTDAAGHFQLKFPRDDAANAKGGSAQAGAAAAPIPPAAAAVFIRDSEGDQAVIYRDKDPMTPDFGAIAYREIVSDASSRPPVKTQGRELGAVRQVARHQRNRNHGR